jgi:hypothetical protein
MMLEAIDQLPRVVVCGVRLELDELDVSLEEEAVFDDDAVVDFVLVCWESAHAIAPPRESSAATLPAATARLVRCAFGFFRSMAIACHLYDSRRVLVIWNDGREPG